MFSSLLFIALSFIKGYEMENASSYLAFFPLISLSPPWRFGRWRRGQKACGPVPKLNITVFPGSIRVSTFLESLHSWLFHVSSVPLPGINHFSVCGGVRAPGPCIQSIFFSPPVISEFKSLLATRKIVTIPADTWSELGNKVTALAVCSFLFRASPSKEQQKKRCLLHLSIGLFEEAVIDPDWARGECKIGARDCISQGELQGPVSPFSRDTLSGGKPPSVPKQGGVKGPLALELKS